MNRALVIPVFFSGFILALLVFGFNTPLLPKFQISYSLPGSWPDWIGSISTTFAVLVALIIAIWGKFLGELFVKSSIVITGFKSNIQYFGDIPQGQSRLIIENQGNASAEDVEVYVDRIVDDGNARANFIPVPLSWTHYGQSQRSFHPNQYGYLDLCRIDDNRLYDQNPNLVLSRGQGVKSYEEIHSEDTELLLVIFQKSGHVTKYDIHLKWRRGMDGYVRVEKITKI